MTSAEGERRLAAIMYTDIVGYTSLTQKDEALAMQLLEEHRRAIRPFFPRHNGREVKTMGDAFLIEFPSALEAVRCAFDIQQSMHEMNNGRLPEKQVQLRIGVHVGDVIHSQNDVLGDAVNVASRVEPLAMPGGICVSQQVYDHVRNKFEFPLASIGRKELKNVGDRLEVYRVVMPWESTGPHDMDARLPANRVAVLPFISISPDPNDDYFADGLTEELIGRLSLLSGLEVIARTSAMTYKKKEKTVAQIGKELGAGTILEGSVRKAGNRIRVTAQLIDANTEGHMWMENYDRSLEDIFAVQTDVAEKVARSLQLRLTELEKRRIAEGGTSDMEAYTLYLKGAFHAQHITRTELSTAIDYYEKALAKDSNYTLAYCGLAFAYCILGFNDMMDNRAAIEKAKQCATKALELDDSVPNVYASFAFAHLNEHDFLAAAKDAEKAIELNPSYANAHLMLAYIFHYTGRRDDSLREMGKSVELDPLSVNTAQMGGTLYLYSGLYDEAVLHLKNALELDPGNTLCLDNLGLAHIQKGLVEQGLEEVERARKMAGGMSYNSDMAYAYVKAGKPAEARKVLSELLDREKTGKVPLPALAGVYAVLGEKEEALRMLERAYDAHSGYLLAIGEDFVFDGLREEPRFLALLDKMGLKRVERVSL